MSLLKTSKFVASQEDSSTVVIDNSQVKITESEHADANGKAPDHLFRLFAYNDIMKKVSGNYFNEKFINEAIISEAQKAYVVSPVSSLIVLETQKDYDRFGIEDSKDSLKNATMKSSGAVPEPHEWLLILLAASIVIYFMSKNYFGQKTQG